MRSPQNRREDKRGGEIMRSVRLKFITESDKPYSISLKYAAGDLASAQGAERIKRAMDALVNGSVIATTLKEAAGAELIERTMLELD